MIKRQDYFNTTFVLRLILPLVLSLPVCTSSGDVGGVSVTREMAGSRWEAGT